MTKKKIEKMIRDEFCGDRIPRPDLLAERIVAVFEDINAHEKESNKNA